MSKLNVMKKQFYLFGGMFQALVLLMLLGCSGGNNLLLRGYSIPDVELPDAHGNVIALSSIKNKIILLDFWASWCKPCLEAQPEMKRLYNKYQNAKMGNAHGFTIYGVSLDNERDAWLAALKKAELPGIQVNDPKGFGSKCVEDFQFEQIPTTYLIDERGIIIGNNLNSKWMDYELNRRMR